MAVAVRTPSGRLTSPADITVIWRERIQQARDARKPFENTWLSNLAFAAGQHWLVFPDPGQPVLRHISRVDPRYADRDLYTADRINEYRQAQLGELGSDDDRPELLTAQDGDTAEETAKALNDAVAYAWEHEWHADEALAEAHQLVLDLGTAAIRRRWDPTIGPVVGHQPLDRNSRPVTPQTHPADWAALAQTGQLADGSLPTFKPVHEGASVLDVYSPFGILPPPGVTREARFPWEILVRPVALDQLQGQYPQLAAELVEDTDIASALGLSTGQTIRDPRSQGSGASPRLRGHVWLYTCFERPCPDYPQGRVCVIASNQYVLLEVRDQLDYQLPDGTFHSGVSYMHWWRLNDRFLSRSFIEPMKDPQRAINNLETMKAEIVARGGPKVLVKKGAHPNPRGLPLEVIELDSPQADAPIYHPGIGPGEWMNVEKAGHEANLAHASTLSQVRLGENPQNVITYSQLALLNELESGKRSVIIGQHKRAVGELVELGVYDIRRYWPDEKLIFVTGDEDKIARATFQKAQIPDFYMVKVAKGAPKPRSQGAELKKIDAIWAATVQSGAVAQDPQSWIGWYVDSINAGVAQDIPEPSRGSQEQLAAFENLLMEHGVVPPPADYDLFPVHLPIHRAAQDQARAVGDLELFQRIDQHVQASIAVQQQNAARVTTGGPPTAPGPAAAPGGAPQIPAMVRPDFLRLAAGL